MLKKPILWVALVVFLVLLGLGAGFYLSKIVLVQSVPTRTLEEQSYKDKIEAGSVSVENINKVNIDFDRFAVYLSTPVLLVSKSTLPDSSITELVWQIENDNVEAFRFKILSTNCWLPGTSGSIELVPKNLEALGEGRTYNMLVLLGLNEPLIQEQLFNKALDGSGRDMTDDCRQVYGNLTTDPNLSAMIREFIDKGQTDSFTKDENGVYDLTKKVTFHQIF